MDRTELTDRTDLAERIDRQTRPAPATPPSAQPLPAADCALTERHLGCGWFDSSHDLQCGLAVCVHDNPDDVAKDLPVDVWISWQLADWQRAGAEFSQPAPACA